MKVMKSLLLGAAAGLVATAGAQAADLPVKAKPVEYVKICPLYGAGFYYIPGTDICLRVGGYVFAEAGVKGRSAAISYPTDRDDNYTNWRSRGHVILDARTQTAYGTLRSYFVGGVSVVNPTAGAPGFDVSASVDRAFIEFAGFTAGYTESFFSFGGAYSIVSSNALAWDWVSTLAYTANLGGGVTATLAIEDAQITRSEDGGRAAATAFPTQMRYGGQSVPDVVGNIRVTQAWGAAQVMAALKEHRPVAGGGDRDWGYAVGAGIEIKTPWTGAPNNSFLLQGVWTEGAIERTGIAGSPLASPGLRPWGPGGASTHGWGDAYYTGAGNSYDAAEAWSVYAAYRHFWTPALRTGFAFGYNDFEAPGGSLANDFTLMQAHVSTVWSPVSGLDLSLDLVWTEVDVDYNPGSRSDDLWTAWYRIRRNF
jgi:hypothetical protein